MKLRSGAQIAQVASGRITQKSKTNEAIAGHNASSLFLRLPQEIKNHIYEFICGGRMVHILQNNEYHQHIHDDETVALSHAICVEPHSEERVQEDFDSTDPDTVEWNIAAIEHRHEICHLPPPKPKEDHTSNQLNLTHLRSCRQIYLEARMVHYAKNTFAIFCNDVLERFAKARFRNQQHHAIRSLYLDISISHPSDLDGWSASLNKAVLRRFKSVRCLHLNLAQTFCACCIEVCSFEGSDMTKRQGKMLEKLAKLPLRKVTLTIDDTEFLIHLQPFQGMVEFDDLEQQYRWTMKQKQDFSKKVRKVLLS